MHPEMMINSIKKLSQFYNRRLMYSYYLFILIIIFIVLKLVYIQVFERKKLEQICETKNQVRLIEQAPRGDIIDKNNRIIATSIIGNVLYIDKNKISNKTNLINNIVKCGILDYEIIEKRLNSPLRYIPLAYNIDKEKTAKLHSLKSKGIIIKKEQLRYYVNPTVFSNLIGFIGMENNGLEGIEYRYNNILKGINGFTVYERKPNGRIYKHPNNPYKSPVKGKNIQLTIDYKIQEIAHNQLKKYVDKLHAHNGNVIIMEVKTGKILAMANYPSYNNNLYGKGDVEKCKNYSILSLYEPGSIFKLVTAAAALEYNIITPEEIVKSENEDSLIINNHIIKDAHKTGALCFRDAFIESSNIGFVNIGNRIGKRLLYVMINRMGFNKKVNIGLPGEQKGYLMPEDKWIPIHQANICFGQGISVNSLQMIAAYNIVANKGVYVKPNILSKINNRNVIKDEKKRVIKKETAEKLNSMLIDVVKYGTGKKASVNGITIAGKTGTAEKSTKGKGYVKGKFTSSFVGYFPAENPEIIMIITLDEPYIYWGSEAAAPLFANITKRLLNLQQYRYLIRIKPEIHS